MRHAIQRCDLAHRDQTDAPQLKVESSVPNKVRASLVLEKRNCASALSKRLLTCAVNRLGGLHGGVIASLVDTMGTLALSSRGMWLTGVVRAADATTALIRVRSPRTSTSASCAAAGQRAIPLCARGGSTRSARVRGHDAPRLLICAALAFTSVEIRHPDTNKLLAHGSHTKVRWPCATCVRLRAAGAHSISPLAGP